MSGPSEIITSPKGGGALQGIGEKFSPDLFTGTGNFNVPIALPSGRNGLRPQLSLAYSSGNGNGPFGVGWGISIAGVSRKTSKGIPHYEDVVDTFILSGAEDLVPVASPSEGIVQYRPRTEGLFARILHRVDATNDFWEVKSKDGLTSLYGTPTAKGKDPSVVVRAGDASRSSVFSWKLSQTKDAFGNLIQYAYARDQNQTDGVHSWDQLYLSQIRYVDFGDPSNPSFLVSVNFTYQDRPDHFSDYRAGFEIRTVQRCSRIEVVAGADGQTPVRTYHLDYVDEDPKHPELSPIGKHSLLWQVRVEGHDGLNSEWLPPLEFGYTKFQPEKQKLTSLAGNLPGSSLADKNLELVDLFGKGLPDILEMNGTVRYWRNEGSGQFALPQAIDEAPAGLQLSDKGVQLLDANGDGTADLLVTTAGLSGYYPMRFNGSWDRHSFQRYRVAPSFDLKDPEVRFLDLDGDGVTDAIRSSIRLECYFNDPKQGWVNSRWVERKSSDVFPDVDFADDRVKFADMTGDGLQDIVLVHDGLVEYWPSLGKGNWAARVEMAGPRFPWGYDPKRVLLGDVDGDGAADLVYVDNGSVTLWLNQQGNRWSDPILIRGTPLVSDLDSIRFADAMGNGVSGLLWSKDANGVSSRNYFFLDFTGGVKPYLLNELNSHMGSLTKVEYKPSTWFYVQDQQRPETRWITPLPFPVQVVSRVETADQFSGSKLTAEYSYHHGYWDGYEREFRGFGRVDHRDTEVFSGSTGAAPQYFSPPTEARTWFHQGAVGDSFDGWAESDSLSGQKSFVTEYYQEPWPGDQTTPQLLSRPQSMANFFAGMRLDARRDAFRSLRGNVLRTELYALDGSERETRPYTVTERVYGVREESPPGPSDLERLHVFFPVLLSERTTQWERGNDPSSAFKFTDKCDEATGSPLDYDTYGQLLSTISIAVPRGRAFRLPAAAGQPYLTAQNLTIYAQRDDAQIYFTDRVSGSTIYEVVNDGSSSVFALAKSIQSNTATRNIVSNALSFYDGTAFQGLPFGQIGNYGALVRAENLVLTTEILQAAYGANIPPYFTTSGSPNWTNDYPQEFRNLLPPLAGYSYQAGGIGSPYETGYYRAAEQRKYDFQDDPQGKGRGLTTVKRDPLGHDTSIAYDSFALLPVSVKDAIGLTTTANHDYRVFQPNLLTDPNGNQTAYQFTPLGLLAKIYVMGKSGEGVGDLPAAPSTQFAHTFMGTDSSGQLVPVADLGQPVSVLTIRRTHHATETDVPQPARDQTIQTIQFSDGFGRVLQTRTQAEDILFDSASLGNPVFGDAGLPADQSQPGTDAVGQQSPPGEPFVVVGGWQIYDNKGQVVEKYEPFFSTGWGYAEPGEAQLGQKATLYYDPRGHVIRTVNPDSSEQRVVYGVPGTIANSDLSNPDIFEPTPWEAYTYDADDNAGRTHPTTTTAFQQCWNTPSSILVDSLGRTIQAVERNKSLQPDGSWSPIVPYASVSTYDIVGNLLTIADPLGRTAFTYTYDLMKRALCTISIDSGARVSVPDPAGNIVEQRDSKGSLILHSHDVLNRPVRMWASDTTGQTVTLREKIIYADDLADSGLTQLQAVAANLLGKPYKHYDEAGLLTFNSYDFKGNLLDKTRNVITEAALLAAFSPPPPNWTVTPFRIDLSSADLSFLDTAKVYETTTTYDALNRIKTTQYPQAVDGSRKLLVPQYNHAGALESVQMDAATYVERVAYNAKGQRIFIAYGNGVMTRYAYDPETFRLLRMRTENYTLNTAAFTYHPSAPATPLQDFSYLYDLVGNILEITDRTPGSGMLNNPEAAHVQDPVLAKLLVAGNALLRDFAYDPIYRLSSATGRECDVPPPPPPWDDTPRCTDITKTRLYTETYQYDNVGNMASWKHGYVDSGGSSGGRTRLFSLTTGNNRLAQLRIDATTAYQYSYDANGNLVQENTDRHLEWDESDRMRVFRVQTDSAPPSLYAQYLYDSGGQRVMKLVRNQSGGYETTIYIDGIFECQRSVSAASATIENNSLHVMDNQKRVGIVRVGTAFADDNSPAIKYHLGDHLGSSNVIVDSTGAWVSREEYLPYGETGFGSFARKRYRFTGKERDAESGLYYHGARYYAPWLARWMSEDPEGLADGVNVYRYARDNPLRFTDPSGRMSKEEGEQFVAGMTERNPHFQLPSKQPDSWAGVLTHAPSSLAIDPTRGEPFERIMTAKWTLEVAQGVSLAVLLIVGGEIAPIGAALSKAPAAVRVGLGLIGAFSGGISFGESLTGRTIFGKQLALNQQITQFIVGAFGLSVLTYAKLGIGEPTNLENFNKSQQWKANRAIGTFTEGTPATQQLQKEGFRILGKQVRVSAGGNPRIIDTLAEKDGQLYNVESKAGAGKRSFSQQVADEHMAAEGATFGKRSMNAPADLRGKTVLIKTIVR